MTYLLILILGVVVAVAFLFWIAKRESKQYGTGTGEELVGICVSAIETASQKEGRKQRVLVMLQEKNGLSNAYIRKVLGVSSRSVVNYMDELEKEGKVEQIGKVGQSVTYRAK
ncbi:MAG: hypothetical protein A3A98_03235 [Candidatus Staskawiczbacteria bacterium RIFCSPLOWO2_01_FULL_40_39]|uniref:Helix-turn-helix type 11 domain-containing protein n=1 Tax=Candidatus Staskawiczbacteria bacterium RIFCSPHIGHO2_01_FULL_39_25 TaxID=1802202 RepID=A0A1G2HPT0_9BACT|nr:MAG: hypothetical protein A2730_02515 [Candidatus Staskawiczbacteria bacterium RIFCSPHIGHO2_01_FULL_39_25]OGZ72828.1 MAG: hypothetical protein A3A98_03235 [Candidatus Staskawiczbacteria bacterium RIFCSPLOWO2_01_FULL_40_39]OGZ76802.1 MAG: hypothetical protein A3I87_02010 [Candidatus Staskawiczbacteria bacterium RIFCSPLOWO2_02_FULL_39_8]